MICEIRAIDEVIAHLDVDAFVFFDLDNTLIESIHPLGSDSWERHLIQQYLEMGFPKEKSFSRASLLWSAIQVVSAVRFVEERIVHLLTLLDQRSIVYEILTARSADLIQTTEKQLKSLGIDWPGAPTEYISMSNNQRAVRKGKIIYCSEHSKGEVLENYFRARSSFPKKVVLIDDRIEHLIRAEEVLGPRCTFIGMRYGFLDQRHEDYEPDAAARLINEVFLNPEANRFLLQAFNIS